MTPDPSLGVQHDVKMTHLFHHAVQIVLFVSVTQVHQRTNHVVKVPGDPGGSGSSSCVQEVDLKVSHKLSLKT